MAVLAILGMIAASRRAVLHKARPGLAGFVCICLACHCFAGPRETLVIGNSNYEGAGPKNPAKDADAMAAALRGLGFHVIDDKDLGKREMDDALVKFSNKLAKAECGLLLLRRPWHPGQRRELPGFRSTPKFKEFDVADESLSLDKVLRALEEHGRLHVVVLDCAASTRSSGAGVTVGGRPRPGSGGRGPRGTLIAFSTAPNTEAKDGKGDNSPYTQELARVLQSCPPPGLELVNAFREASRAVRAIVPMRWLTWRLRCRGTTW